MRRKKEVLSKTSITKINQFIESIKDIITDDFIVQFNKVIQFDVKNIKDCKESSIVEFYIKFCKDLLLEFPEPNDEFWKKLKSLVRHELVKIFVSNESFDNNIDIYFNEVKKEYILHPMNESEELEFLPENKDIFIKNNLKLVIDCAKRYRGLGLPFEDLIQTGNLGLMIAYDKFDTDRANLQHNIIKSIINSKNDEFSYNEASNIIKENFKYTKLLESTLMKIPKEGFENKEKFQEWVYSNIKKASFSSIGFSWIRATITSSLGKLVNLVHIPKTALDKGYKQPNVIKLDSINPHTDDNYSDNIINEYYNSDEFLVEDDSMEQIERKNMFKDLLSNILIKMNPLDVRIIKKRFGIDYPFEMSIQEISENEGISINKVKNSINNSLEFISKNINPDDRSTLIELLK